MPALRLLGAALAKFDRDRGFFLASAIAFQGLLCLVPLSLLLLSFAGSYLFADERVADQLGRYLGRAAPAIDPVLHRGLLDIVRHRGTSGVVGTIGLLWIATTVFGWLRMAMSTIFGVPTKARGTLRGLGLDLVMIVLSGAAFLGSVGLTAVFEYLRRLPYPRSFAAPGGLPSLALGYVVPFLLTLLICFLVYRLLPDRRVSARAALWGALFTGVLWEAAKHVFTWYAAAFEGYSIVYGSLGAAAMLLSWAYYSAAVLLLGAEVTALLDGVPARPAGPSPPGREA